MIKIERKFLVEYPLHWFARTKISFTDKIDIYQTYLTEPDEEVNVISKVKVAVIKDFNDIVLGTNSKIIYSYDKKRFIKDGIFNEWGMNMTQEMFRNKLNRFYSSKKYRVSKTRYVLDKNKKVNLDVFKCRLEGLAILKFDLNSLSDEITFHPYIKTIKEITNDSYFYNSNLASLERWNQK